jgi:RNA polymerase sigma-70 factor, ECF subfamily
LIKIQTIPSQSARWAEPPAGVQARALDPEPHEAGSDRADGVTAAELYERHLEDVFRYVLHRIPREEEAEDITAEVFAAAFAGLARFRGECPPHVWLLAIARRKIIDARRRRRVRQETLASELGEGQAAALWEALTVEDGPEAALIRAEARRMLGELVARLRADQREALMLRYVEGLSVAEIAQVMGRSHGSVKGLLERARAALFRHGRDYFTE